MKWLSSKFTYPLIIVSLIASILLQLAWLQQLFVAQKLQLKELIEQNVGEAAKVTIFNSLAEKKLNNTIVKKFFLSPQWLQMRQAFDDLKMNGIHSVFDYGITDDSSFVEMKFTFKNRPSLISKRGPAKTPGLKDTMPPLLQKDTSIVDVHSLVLMNREIKNRMIGIGITGPVYYAVYKYGNEELDTLNLPKKYVHHLEFASKIYSYNLKHIHKYQLLIPVLNGAVFYRMRYYMISSLLMLILTAASFYFILQLLKKQKLYADAKLSFTNNMTHEFKTPVATVSVALESITKYNLIDDPEKLKRYLDISRTELKRLDIMIEKVLNLNQNIEHTPLNLELYDVQAGLEQIIESMKIPLENNQFILTFYKSDVPCFVYGDPVHLANVFYNLIDNAIKYAGTGSALEITSSCNENEVIIKYKDNGIGIDSQYLQQVFDRFFRIPSPGDTHNVKGSGLGLHYVRQIIEEHKGQIALKSEVNHGCTFIIKLPKA